MLTWVLSLADVDFGVGIGCGLGRLDLRSEESEYCSRDT